MYFRFINVKYGSEFGTVLLHEGDNKNDLKKLQLKIAHTFNLLTNQFTLVPENDFITIQLKK